MWTTSHSSATHNNINYNNNNNNNNNNEVAKNMEDVWRDISSGTDIIEPVSSGRVILQDFFSKDLQPPPVQCNVRSATPTPPGMLTLRGSNSVQETNNNTNHYHSNNKRFMTTENEIDCDANRRHKRMIKNRESAARSRARKQAYTNELELEVAHLLEENARLKKQQQQFCAAAAANQRKSYKSLLNRTSSAPF